MELCHQVVLTLPIVNYFKVQELFNGVSCKGFSLLCFNSFVQKQFNSTQKCKQRMIFICIGISKWYLCNTKSKSNWLFNTQSRVMQIDWLLLEDNEKAILSINMPYCMVGFLYAFPDASGVACPYIPPGRSTRDSTSYRVVCVTSPSIAHYQW